MPVCYTMLNHGSRFLVLFSWQYIFLHLIILFLNVKTLMFVIEMFMTIFA